MIVHSSIGGLGRVPARRPGHLLIASLDVEWTKNYRIKNGNVPFCWSVTWLQIPHNAGPVALPKDFHYTSAYVATTSETQDLIDSADAEIRAFTESADLVIGHQVSSDLAVLRNASQCGQPHVEDLRERWHGRRGKKVPQVIDSRYDVDGVLNGKSRRLVDVCTELALDVKQPELARTSMTALHRVWLNDEDPSARERISVLNLRHGLSAAYVALRSAELCHWIGVVNTNAVLHEQLEGTFAWLDTPTFARLL